MANGRSGKAVFDQRVEYPLPRRAGIKDYIIYVVGQDGYGKSARKFFDRFYRQHVSRSVSSLEEMIDFLATEVAGGVTQIRELVIVAHAAPQGLITPVLRTVPANLPVMRDVTFRSLAVLQRGFEADDASFATFKARRARVVATMLDDSWVTIRACRVGQGAEVMYGLYSFFGGRANVYAPREYQFFGVSPIAPGMRTETRVQTHAHLVKQRFFPRDVHTPNARNAIVASVADPGRFAEPFDLASARIGDTTSAEAFTYQGFVTSLNRSRVSAPLRSEFTARGHELSPRTQVQVSVRDAAWIVVDPVTHASENAKVKYDVGEVVENAAGEQRATLRAWAALAETDVEKDWVPLQLFFYDSHNDLFKGKVGTLAAYLEEPGTQDDQARLDALVAAMPPAAAAPVPLDPLLVTELDARTGVQPTTAARIRLASTQTKHGQQYLTWAIEDQEPYLVKLEHPVTANDVQGHMVSLVLDLKGPAKLRAENRMMAHLGEVPDTPGTELAAYLDRATLEELLAVLDFLRKPYQPEHSLYLHHALQAIKRKKEYLKWSMDKALADTDPLGPLTDPHESLVGSEAEDKRSVVHGFDFNGIWQEVKVSHRSLGTFTTDLFDEEDIWAKFGAAGDPAEVVAGLDPDSPFTDLDEQREAHLQAFAQFSRVDKTAFEPADNQVDCHELAVILTKWRDLQGSDADEIERQLGLLTASDGATFADHVHWLYDKLKLGMVGLNLMNISFMQEGLVVKIASKIPVIGIASEYGVPTTFTALLRALPAITIPLTLWLKTVEAQAEANAVWETTGRLTAVRQWLRQLILQTFRPEFPENVNIDLGWFGSSAPHVDRYFQEQRDEHGFYFQFVWAPDRMKKGFDEGVRSMEKGLEEILERADDAVDDILRQLGVNSCQAKVLVEAGVLDLPAVRGRIARAIANDLLEKLPRI